MNDRSRGQASGGRASAQKSLEQLRKEAKLLERDIEDRKLLLVDLCEQKGTPPTKTSDAKLGQLSADDQPVDDLTFSDDAEAEIHRLASRNAFLRDELMLIAATEQQLANNPRVRDKRNEVRLIRMKIEEVEHDIETLQAMKKRRDQGLRAIGRTEEQARQMRCQQHGLNAELREEVRRLTEELREVEKQDIELHESYAGLQEQMKLSVTDADVQQLRDDIKKYEEEISTLTGKLSEWRKRRDSVRNEDHRSVAKCRREVAKLADEEKRLQELLLHKDLELKRSYQLCGRMGLGGGG